MITSKIIIGLPNFQGILRIEILNLSKNHRINVFPFNGFERLKGKCFG